MRPIRLAAVALLACTPVAGHAAPDSAPAAASSETDAPAEKPKKICRTEVVTGSIRPKRVCRTPEQMAADEQAAQRTRETLNRQQGNR